MKLTEYEELICFAAIGEAGSLTGAASQLGCSKAHVSRKLSSLERRAKVKLVHRSTRHLAFTAAGETLRSQAELIYHSSRLSNRKVADLENELQGPFVITAPVFITSYFLLPLLPKLQSEFPKLEFEIIPTHDNLKLVRENVDIAIRIGHFVDGSLVATHVGLARDVFFASTRIDKLPLKVEDLYAHRLLLNPTTVKNNQVSLIGANDLILSKLESKMLIQEYPPLLSLVESEFGIGLAPNYCEQSYPNIQRVLPDASGPEWPVYLLHPFETPISQKLARVKELLATALGEFLVSENDQGRASH